MQKLKFDKSNYSQQEVEHAKNILLNYFSEILTELEAEGAEENEIDQIVREIEILKTII